MRSAALPSARTAAWPTMVHWACHHTQLIFVFLVEKGATIKDSIIMEESHVGKDSRVIKAILDQEVRIGQNCLIGGEEAITVVGMQVEIGDNKTLEAGKMIEPKETI